MSNPKGLDSTPLDEQSEELIQPNFQEIEDIQAEYPEYVEQDQEIVQEAADSDFDNCFESDLDSDRAVRRQNLEHRSRASSLSSGRSVASAPSCRPTYKVKTIDKGFHFPSPQQNRQSPSGYKRSRSSNSSGESTSKPLSKFQKAIIQEVKGMLQLQVS